MSALKKKKKTPRNSQKDHLEICSRISISHEKTDHDRIECLATTTRNTIPLFRENHFRMNRCQYVTRDTTCHTLHSNYLSIFRQTNRKGKENKEGWRIVMMFSIDWTEMRCSMFKIRFYYINSKHVNRHRIHNQWLFSLSCFRVSFHFCLSLPKCFPFSFRI